MDILNIDDYEAIARERMERTAFDYYAGAAGDERTLAENRRAFDDVVLRPRVLVDVSSVDVKTTVIGQALSFPVMLAPTAFNRLAHPDGELAAARAAGAAGTVMVASTLSTFSLEEIAAAARSPAMSEAEGRVEGWFQLYVYKDRALTRDLVARAEAAGYRAIVLTVDTPVLGRRERDARNKFVLPQGISMKNFEAAMSDASRWGTYSSFAGYVHDLFDTTLTWSAVEWLRTQTKLPVLIKGILTAEDAKIAVDAGADGIIVSNHGGRQLDGVPATVAALPEVAEAVSGRADVMMDGGIRRGTDVLKALALGARAVCIGRAYLWGLAVDGEAGVRGVLGILRSELELAMALAGRPSIASIDASLVRR